MRSIARQRHEKAKHYRRRLNRPLTARLIKRGVLSGTIPSAISDTGVTSIASFSSDHTLFGATGQRFTNIFHVANGSAAPASEVRLLQHRLRDPARTIDMVPSLRGASLLSTGKLTDAGYVTIYDSNEVNVYDSRTARVHVSEAAVLQGWQCPRKRLWRIPLSSNVKDINTDTLLLDSPDGRSYLNTLYHVPPVSAMQSHIEAMCPVPCHGKQSTMSPNCQAQSPLFATYLHAAAGFPTKATWLKAIHRGNYLSSTLVNVKNAHKYFPESEETHKGHMRSQRQDVHST